VIELTLPYPPSLNKHYKFIGHRVLISFEGLEYVAAVKKVVKDAGVKMMTERLKVDIWLYPPDARVRDDDNGAIVIAYCLKPLFDAMQKAHVYRNDRQIKKFQAELCGIVPGGKAVVRIVRHEESEGPGA
jgi:crossover junction endodeoxyribonuclease RusA